MDQVQVTTDRRKELERLRRQVDLLELIDAIRERGETEFGIGLERRIIDGALADIARLSAAS